MRKVAQTFLDLKDELFTTMSEGQREAFWTHIKPHIDQFSWFAAANATDHPEWLEQAMNFRIQTKGLLFSTSSGLRKALRSNDDPRLTERFNDWVNLREELLIQYNTSEDERSKGGYSTQELKEEIEELERELSSILGSDPIQETMTFETIKNSLGKDEAVVEVVRVQSGQAFSDEPRYLIYVIDPGAEFPRVVELSESPLLENAYYKQYINSIYYQMEDMDSYTSYWRSIDKQIPQAKKVYVVNDGIYNLINLEGLSIREGVFLGDEVDINYITDLAASLTEAETYSYQRSLADGRICVWK